MKTLVIFSHSFFKDSRIHKALLEKSSKLENVTVRNLEELYGQNPENIDIAVEQKLIEEAERIVLQFPVFWFNSPAMMKGFLDRVFTYGWAYGSQGHALEGKVLQLVVSTGSGAEKYQAPTVEELLKPYITSALFTGMKVAPIFTVYGALGKSDEDLATDVADYIKLLG